LMGGSDDWNVPILNKCIWVWNDWEEKRN
jgi:hypothetical protein